MNKRKIGAEYEEKAAKLLISKGHKIIDRNFRYGRLAEIDIISKDGDTIVFTEVKYRQSKTSGYPFESVGMAKQRRISEAARRFIYMNELSLDAAYRFDVIGVMGDDMEHIENAFYYIGR